MVCLCLATQVYAQIGNIHFFVKTQAGEPLMGAVIHSGNKHTVTDSNGRATISNVRIENLEYMISFLGYETFVGTIEMLSENTYLEVIMEESINELQQVVVCAEAPNTLGGSVPEIHLHKEDLRTFSNQSLGDALKNVSGVTTLNTGGNIAKPIIHGMHSSRIVMMNNGVRQEDMEWGVEHAPNMDVNAYGELKIIKGASALRFGGNAVGGVILAQYPKLLVKDTIQGEIAINGQTNGRGGSANFLLQKGYTSPWAWQIQSSYKQIGDLKAPRYYLTNSGVKQKAFVLQTGYTTSVKKIIASYSYFTTDIAILKAAHIGNLTDLATAINSKQPYLINPFSYKIDKPYQKVHHHLAKIEAEKMFEFGKISAQYAFQFNRRYEYDVRIGQYKDTPSMNIGLATHSYDVVITPFDFWNHTLDFTFGINGMLQDNTSNPNTQVKRLIPDYLRFAKGAFVSADWVLNPNTNISLGIRFDYNRINTKKYYYKRYWERMNYDADFANNIIGDYGNQWLTHFIINHSVWSGTLGTSHTFKDGSAILFNYSLAGRAPNPSELFSEGIHHSVMAVELGDVRIEPEKAHKFSLNYRKFFPLLKGLRIDGTVYHNYINDYIYQIPTGAEYTLRGAFPVWSFKQIDAVIQGFDLDITLDFTENWNLQTQFAYLYGQDKTNHIPLISMPPLEWKALIEYRWKNAFKPFVRIGFQQVFEQKRFPDYDFTLTNIIENGVLVDKKIEISQPPKGYSLVEFRTGISFLLGSQPIQIYLSAQNLLNTSYRNYLNRFRFFADEMGRQVNLQIIYQF